jgi:hypothetical protein
MYITNKEKLFIVQQRIKDSCRHRDELTNQVINDIGLEAFENGETHSLLEEISNMTQPINALFMEMNRLLTIIQSDIIE